MEQGHADQVKLKNPNGTNTNTNTNLKTDIHGRGRNPRKNCTKGNNHISFIDSTLSWWKGHVKTLDLGTPNSMSWEDLKVMMMKESLQNSQTFFWME